MSSSDGIRKRDLVVLPPATHTEWQYTTPRGGTTNRILSDKNVRLVGQEITTSRDNWSWTTVRRMERNASRKGRTFSSNTQQVFDRSDLGNGSFESIKKYVEGSPRWVNPRYYRSNSTGVVDAGYSGPWYAVDCNIGSTSTRYPAVPTDLRDRMIALGTTAIARTIPTNPIASASVFLGELVREGLPIPGKQFLENPGAHGLAGEYLNYEFGLKPVISDLKKFREAYLSANKRIDQLKRDSGRLVRRRYSFPEERTVETTHGLPATGSPTFNSGASGLYSSISGKLSRTRVTTTRFWFSGAYTYVYPDGDQALGRMKQREQELNVLFGSRVTPATLWNLAPWSWLVDWKSNAGEVVHNLSAFANDGLVLRWGYMMCHMTIKDTYLLDGIVLRDGSGGPLSQTFVTDVKKRVKATPYGFGLDPGAFTTRQWAILGALGISRAPGQW